ncbi:alpha-amylase family protein [Haladaptatus pallidirubidus]|uniref:Alpha-amylase family protein n=1 Tax=Haladaptatus pallidirubidus TaxID=1008152 RepID=A0AAV3USL6_9EURY|nr:alpha-amylase family protein [Haladaptatus pallidirubidus]
MQEIESTWYQDATIYSVDLKVFQDTDENGIGDFQGLIDRLDYFSKLGIDCIWLLPFYPSPGRDNGYDVMDYYGVDPQLGTLGDFVEFVRAADDRGIRVIIDFVVNHTSDQHPWFQAARSDPNSKYRDFYLWADEKPQIRPDRGPVFPGEEDHVWSYDNEADAYYYHRFYHFQPDLNIANQAVREEAKKILGFWLELGVAGFRIDAAGLLTQTKGLTEEPLNDPHSFLKELREFVSRRRSDAVLLAEADTPPAELGEYFGESDEMHLLLNFQLNAHILLALARGESAPLTSVLKELPDPSKNAGWANFLRNLDELNIGALTEAEQADVYEEFAPDETMRIYDRGIRRRLAPILDGNDKHIKLAYSLLFSLPGTPIIVYGDEIGMGEDLDQPGRFAVRTPMQWTDAPNAGFSTADPDDLIRPIISDETYAPTEVNVADRLADPNSLLNWISYLIRTYNEFPALARGDGTILNVDHPAVFAHASSLAGETMVTVHNLSDESATITLPLNSNPTPVFGDANFGPDGDSLHISLSSYGYCWFQL